MKIRIHNPIYGVPITFLDKWRPFEPVYILNPDRYANEYIISSVIKPFISVSCLTTTQFRIVDARNIAFNEKQRNKSTMLIKDADSAINGKATYARICIKKSKSFE